MCQFGPFAAERAATSKTYSQASEVGGAWTQVNPNREVSRVIGARLAVGMAMRTKIPRIGDGWLSLTVIALTIIALTIIALTIIAFTIIAFMVITAVSLVHKKISWRFAREFTTQKNFLRASREFTTQKNFFALRAKTIVEQNISVSRDFVICDFENEKQSY